MTVPINESLIVLGGTGRLGSQALPILADAGYHVVAFSRREVSGAPYDHPRITVKVGSLDNVEFIDAMISSAIERTGVLRGGIFLNGGYAGDEGIGADGFTETLQRMMEMNVYPITRVLSRLLPHWEQHCGGRLVLTSATAVTQRFVKGGAYATSKMAVDSLARQIEKEYDIADVAVHVLRPRFIGTKPGQNAPADLAQEMLDAVRGDV